MGRLVRWLRPVVCRHAERDQGLVGYCLTCGDFRQVYESGGLWMRYVRQPPAGARPPMGVGGMPPSIEHQRAAIALERERLALAREREEAS